MDFLPSTIDKCVRRYQAITECASCLDQFRCMAFRESLRDIETCLRAMGTKLYHAGFRIKVARNTLAVAAKRKRRDWPPSTSRLRSVLIRYRPRLYAEDPLGLELEQTAYASGLLDDRPFFAPWASRWRKYNQSGLKRLSLRPPAPEAKLPRSQELGSIPWGGLQMAPGLT